MGGYALRNPHASKGVATIGKRIGSSLHQVLAIADTRSFGFIQTFNIMSDCYGCVYFNDRSYMPITDNPGHDKISRV